MRRHSSYQGFSLLEVMVVVVIIGMLATVVTVGVMSYLNQARRTTAEAQMSEFMKALNFYKMDKGLYPSTGQGLNALMEKKKGSDDSYIKDIPKDPWSNDYQYKSTGSTCEIRCYAADGRRGGDGSGEDIVASSHKK